jgi:hypothetical protein
MTRAALMAGGALALETEAEIERAPPVSARAKPRKGAKGLPLLVALIALTAAIDLAAALF